MSITFPDVNVGVIARGRVVGNFDGLHQGTVTIQIEGQHDKLSSLMEENSPFEAFVERARVPDAAQKIDPLCKHECYEC